MRQVGVLSAAARIALEETFNKLDHTHMLASWLASELQKSGAKITYPVDTNMVSGIANKSVIVFNFIADFIPFAPLGMV